MCRHVVGAFDRERRLCARVQIDIIIEVGNKTAEDLIPLVDPDDPPEKGTLVADLSPIARRAEMSHQLAEARETVNDEAPTTIHGLLIDVDGESSSGGTDRPADPPTDNLERAMAGAGSSLWAPALAGIGIGLVVLAYLLLLRN